MSALTERLELLAGVIKDITEILNEIYYINDEDYGDIKESFVMIEDVIADIQLQYFSEKNVEKTTESEFFKYLKHEFKVLKEYLKTKRFKEACIEFSIHDGWIIPEYQGQKIDNEQLDNIAAQVDEAFATNDSLLSKRLVEHIQNNSELSDKIYSNSQTSFPGVNEEIIDTFKTIAAYHCDEGCNKSPMERHEFSLPIGDADLSPAQERFILNMVNEIKELEFAIKHNLVDIPGEAKLPKSPSNSKSRELEDFAKAIDEQLEREAFIAEIAKAETLEELFDIEKERTPNYVHVDLTNYDELRLFANKTQLDIRQLLVDGVDGLFYDTRNDKIMIKYINGRSEFPSITEYYNRDKKQKQKFESPGVFLEEKHQ